MSSLHTKAVARVNAQRGFTLIEVMVVVVIIAILAAIAIPSYRSHVIKANRSAAESFMSQVANKEEQIMLDMRNYVSVANNAAFAQPPNVGVSLPLPPNVASNYTLSVLATNPGNAPPSFVITAIPNNVTQIDLLCQTLTLDSTGQKGVAPTNAVAPTGAWQTCWQ